jgi:hypothetical protein
VGTNGDHSIPLASQTYNVTDDKLPDMEVPDIIIEDKEEGKEDNKDKYILKRKSDPSEMTSQIPNCSISISEKIARKFQI